MQRNHIYLLYLVISSTQVRTRVNVQLTRRQIRNENYRVNDIFRRLAERYVLNI